MPYRFSPADELEFDADGRHRIAFPRDLALVVNGYEFRPEHRLAPSFHDYLEILHVCDGRGRLWVERREYPLRNGDIVVIGNTERHVVTSAPAGRLRAVAVFFMPEVVYAPGSSAVDFGYLRPFYSRTPSFRHVVPRAAAARIALLVGEIHDRVAKRFPLGAKTSLLELLLALVQHYERLGCLASQPDREQREFDRLRGVLTHMQTHYAEPLSLRECASMAGMSMSHYCRVFRRVTGSTFTQYLMKLRIERARGLLLNDHVTVLHVAGEVGFESHSYFDRIFRRFTGLSPQKYRRSFSLPPRQGSA